jgi:uncharacterized protein YacL (UPF0231 family)
MEKKSLTREEQSINWLKSEIEKDKIELEIEKKKLIESIKNLKKENIFKQKERLTLWMRIKKVMMGS